jgi:hypothetical protein
VYSCSLINNAIPQRWRLLFNDDTDICLQVLAAGWCTILMNAFLCHKTETMQLKGGNTDIYNGDGRRQMARALERIWPNVVTTGRRFDRPQHVVKHQWRRFDNTPILKPQSEWPEPIDYGVRLQQINAVKTPSLQRLVDLSRDAQAGKP